MKKNLVISIFDYNPDWIKFLNDDIKIFLYRKGGQKQRFDEIILDTNVGRDVHTFFKHICLNYESLSDITFFCQDFPFDHWENIIETINGDLDIISKNAQISMGGYFGYHNNTYDSTGGKGTILQKYGIEKIRGSGAWGMFPSTHHHGGVCIRCNWKGSPQHNHEDLNLNYWFKKFFKNEIPGYYEFIPGGHFGVTENQVKLRKKVFYDEIVKFLETDPLAPWIIERLEGYIFNPSYEELDIFKG